MPPLTFYWHDYETFGRDPRRDRPAQFAGLRTDADLNPIGEPLMLHCQPAPDALPDPGSVLLTGILPQHALQHGLPEHAFAAAIERELAADGTIGVGYNSIRFDDEFTRFLFWRNLIDPFAREWQNGCGRWDLMDVLRCCWALRPEGIEWPLVQVPAADGRTVSRPSFKLEHLAAANGLRHDAAHDALSDVQATLALARLLKQRQPRLWEFCLKLRSKDAVLSEIGSGRPFVHLSSRYALDRGSLAVVWPLAMHPNRKNELIVWDLAHDPHELAQLDVETVRRRLFTRQDELPAGELRLPIKTIHINKSPVVISNLRVLGPAAARWALDLDATQRHAERAATLGNTLDALWPEVYARPPSTAAVDVDADLYGGFPEDDDRRALERLRALTPAQLAHKRLAFRDGRLDELVFRYRARNFGATLSDEEQGRWRQHCAARLHQGAGAALTLAAYHEQIDALAVAADAAGDERAEALLSALVDYAEDIAPAPPARRVGVAVLSG